MYYNFSEGLINNWPKCNNKGVKYNAYFINFVMKLTF